MTSTVLDVTVMLLCVSASVVALGGIGGEPSGFTNEVTDVERTADRLATETATVRYGATDEGDRYSVHATLAELLVMATWNDTTGRDPGSEDGDGDADEFTAAALATVSDAFGPRTRIDVQAAAHERAEDGAGTNRERPDGRASRDVGWTRGSNGKTIETDPRDEAIGIGMPRTPNEPDPPHETIGSEPPRGATVTTAVATSPVPDAVSNDTNRARFVVRVW